MSEWRKGGKMQTERVRGGVSECQGGVGIWNLLW